MNRSQVHVSTQHHHTFNVQIQPDLRSPLVQVNLRNNGITFSGVGMLDSGCTTCIIPISRLPEDARRHMSKTNIRFKGIGGNISILGKLTCDITLGDDTSPAFCNVDTLITTSDIPILIGQNILGHHTLLSYTIDNQKATVELARTLPSGKLKHTVPLSTTVHPRIKPTHNLSHGALTVSNEEPRATARSSPNGLTLNQKLHWLKQTVGLSLPDHHSRSELEATADLLISYADILGTDDNRRGTFIKPIRIPTNGQSRSQKQHPIAQALEDDVDAEIARMASEGVIEPCNDPKGFNSPVFAVRKKKTERFEWSQISKEPSTRF